MKLGKALVGDFEVNEDLRDDADDAAAGGKAALGDGAHEAEPGAAVDEAEMAGGEGAA